MSDSIKTRKPKKADRRETPRGPHRRLDDKRKDKLRQTKYSKIQETSKVQMTNLKAPDHIAAPWTQEQVDLLNKYQHGGQFHPYTCGNDRGSIAHKDYALATRQSDDGILVATRDGWRCPVCNYKQDWYMDGFPSSK